MKSSLYEDTERKLELLKNLREALCLHENDISDNELLNMTRGSLIMTEIEIGMCLSALRSELRKAFRLRLFKGSDDKFFKWLYEKVKHW
jgi:hypothetical protein